MRARDADALPTGDQLAECLFARRNRDPFDSRGLEIGMRGCDCRAHDDRSSGGRELWSAALPNHCPQRDEITASGDVGIRP